METCACCGYKIIDEKGIYEICPICYWEDDPVQESNPWFEGGANVPSLYKAQQNYKRFGAMEERFISNVRNISSNDFRDSNWRELVEKDKNFATTPREIEERSGRKKSVSYNYWERNV